MRSYSGSVSPSSRCRGWLETPIAPVFRSARRGLGRGERHQLIPELDHLGGRGLGAPVLGGPRGQLGLEEARLAPGLEVPEREAALDLRLEIAGSVEVDDRKLVPAALGEQGPVVGEPQLLP